MLAGFEPNPATRDFKNSHCGLFRGRLAAESSQEAPRKLARIEREIATLADTRWRLVTRYASDERHRIKIVAAD